jgi:protein-tyrosine phosphatase
MTAILFVCLGNICRSPAAEEIMRSIIKENAREIKDDFRIESCGLGDWHKGHLPDERMRDAAKNRGYILASRAQEFQPVFFDDFDLILVADHKVMNELYRYAASPDYKAKIHLITHFSACFTDQDVPDPYYQGKAGFEHVLDMIEDSCTGLLDHLKKTQ